MCSCGCNICSFCSCYMWSFWMNFSVYFKSFSFVRIVYVWDVFFLFCAVYSCFFVLCFVSLDIFLLCHVFPVLWLYSMERSVERIVSLCRFFSFFEWNLYVYASIGCFLLVCFASGYLLFFRFQVRTLQVYRQLIFDRLIIKVRTFSLFVMCTLDRCIFSIGAFLWLMC